MFDIGFWELLIIGVVGLLVVGPDRLPALATRAGNFIGRMRLKMRRITAEIQQELEAEHLKSLVDQRDQELDSLRREAAEVKRDIDHAARTARYGGAAGPRSHPEDMVSTEPADPGELAGSDADPAADDPDEPQDSGPGQRHS